MRLTETQKNLLEKMSTQTLAISDLTKAMKSTGGATGRCVKSLIEKGFVKAKTTKTGTVYSRTAAGNKAIKN